MRFFGRRYAAPAYEDAEEVDVPVGARCARCEERIVVTDDGWLVPTLERAGHPSEMAFHAACYLRGIVGSVAHQQRRCQCFVPGSTAEDDPALTRRQAAEAAELYFLKNQGSRA